MAKSTRFNRRKVDKIFRHLLMLNLTVLLLLGLCYGKERYRIDLLRARVYLLQNIVCSDHPEIGICKEAK